MKQQQKRKRNKELKWTINHGYFEFWDEPGNFRVARHSLTAYHIIKVISYKNKLKCICIGIMKHIKI